MKEEIFIVKGESVHPGAFSLDDMRILLESGGYDEEEKYFSKTPVFLNKKAKAFIFDSSSELLPKREARRMGRLSQFAIYVASSLSKKVEIPSNTSVVLGTSFGPVDFAEKVVNTIVTRSPLDVSPFHFSESVANTSAARISMKMKLYGNQTAVTQSTASYLAAFIEGAREIFRGDNNVVIVGGTEEITDTVVNSLIYFRALSSHSAPFCRYRKGFIPSEGSTFLLLANGEAIRRFNYFPIGKVLGWARAFDPTSKEWAWGENYRSFVNCMKRACQMAGVTTKDIDLILSAASGSIKGDLLEAKALNTFFNGRLPTVIAPKGIIGEYGATDLAALLVLLEGGKIAKPKKFVEEDPEIGFSPNEAYLENNKIVMVNACSPVGSFVTLIVRRC